MTKISRPTIISFADFKRLISDQSGFSGGRRIIFFERDEATGRWKYRIPIVGKKQDCYKVAYHLLFLEQNEERRSFYIQEGEFKYPISFNFQNAYHLWMNSIPVVTPPRINRNVVAATEQNTFNESLQDVLGAQGISTHLT